MAFLFLDHALTAELKSNYKALTADEELVMITRAKEGCKKAFEALFNSQVLFFVSQCKGGSGVSAEHYLGSCVIALREAIDNFDSSYGVRLIHNLKSRLGYIKQQDRLDTNLVAYHHLQLTKKYRDKAQEEYEQYMNDRANGVQRNYRSPAIVDDITFTPFTTDCEIGADESQALSDLSISEIIKASKKGKYRFDMDDILMKIANDISVVEIAKEIDSVNYRTVAIAINNELKKFSKTIRYEEYAIA